MLFLIGCQLEVPCTHNSWDLILNTNAKSFELDSLSSTIPDDIAFYLDSASGSVFSFLNTLTNSVYLYNYSDGVILGQIRFELEGPDGIASPESYSVINSDSLVLFSSGNRQLYFYSLRGKKLGSYFVDDFRDSVLKYAPYSKVGVHRPVVSHEKDIVTIGSTSLEYDDDNSANRKVLSFIDYENGLIKHEVPYPELYHKGNWWGNYFRIPYYTYDGRDQFVVSFPASQTVSVYNVKKEQVVEYFAGSCNLTTIHPDKHPYDQTHRELAANHYLQMDKFTHILYDPYRKCYYRFGIKGNAEADFKDRDTFLTTIYIIILDDNFNIMGESKLPGKKYGWAGHSFVSPDGLLIARMDNKEEDQLVFDVFSLRKD